jgi:6-phosphofructokinase 1
MALAIMCSGGDAAGMNPAIKKFVDYAFKIGETPYFIYEGLEGLIDNKIKEAAHKDVAGIMHIGGTILRSSRSKRFFEYEHRKVAYENLKKHDITGLIVLGGDGSFRALEVFSNDFKINFVGIPTTIDNDIFGTQYCLGVDTSLNVIRDALDKIRDTSSSFNRAFVVEVMGRDCGYLAAVSSMISGAEICIIPELEFNKEQAQTKLLSELKEGRNYVLAIVAEGTKKTTEIATWLRDDIGFDTRITILGHVQRGGNPTVYDRMMAFEFVIGAVKHLVSSDNSNRVITYNDGAFSLIDIDDVVSKKYMLPTHILESLDYLD